MFELIRKGSKQYNQNNMNIVIVADGVEHLDKNIESYAKLGLGFPKVITDLDSEMLNYFKGE